MYVWDNIYIYIPNTVPGHHITQILAFVRPGLAIRAGGNFPPGPPLIFPKMGRFGSANAFLGPLLAHEGRWDSSCKFYHLKMHHYHDPFVNNSRNSLCMFVQDQLVIKTMQYLYKVIMKQEMYISLLSPILIIFPFP